MFDLLTLERITHCLKKGHKGVKDDVYETMMKVPKNGGLVKYSRELRDLIKFCLHAQPEARATIEELQKNVKMYRDVVSKRCTEQSGRTRPTPDQQDRVYYRGDDINELGAGTFKPLRRLEPQGQKESGPTNTSVTIKFPARPGLGPKAPRDSIAKTVYGDDSDDEVDGPEGANDDNGEDDDNDDGGRLPPGVNLNGRQLFDGNLPRASSAKQDIVPPAGRGPRRSPSSIGRRLNNPIVLDDELDVEDGAEGEDDDEEKDDDEEDDADDEDDGEHPTRGRKGPKLATPPDGEPDAENGPGEEDENDSYSDTDDCYTTNEDDSDYKPGKKRGRKKQDAEDSDREDPGGVEQNGDDQDREHQDTGYPDRDDQDGDDPDAEDQGGDDQDTEDLDGTDQDGAGNGPNADKDEEEASKPSLLPEWARNAAKAALGILSRDNSAEKSKDTSSKETKEQNEETNQEEEDAPERDKDSEDDVIHNGNYRRKRKWDGEQDRVQGTSRDRGSSSKRQRSGRGGGVKKGEVYAV